MNQASEQNHFLASAPLPKLAQAFWAMNDPEGFFAARSRGREPFKVQLPGFSTIHVTGTAKGASDLMGASADHFKTIPGTPVDDILGPNSMMVKDGARHQWQRRMIMPALGPKPMQDLKQIFTSVVARAITEIPGQSTVIDLADLMQDITLRIAIEAVFGVSGDADIERFHIATKDFVNQTSPSLLLIPNLRNTLWPPWRKFLKAQAELDAAIFSQIEKLRSNWDSSPNSVLKIMLAARDADGVGLSELEIRDEMRTLLVAGHETTAMGMTWTFYHGVHDRDIYQQMCREVNACSDILQAPMPYIDAVCNEALRMRAIPPFVFRTLTKPLIVSGQQLHPGDNAALCLILLHSDPKVFEKTDEFCPERFLNKTYGPFEFMPFGHGAKRCIGAFFSQTEMRIVSAALLQAAKFEIMLDSNPKLVLRHINAGPDRKIPIKITKRK